MTTPRPRLIALAPGETLLPAPQPSSYATGYRDGYQDALSAASDSIRAHMLALAHGSPQRATLMATLIMLAAQSVNPAP
jgi:hypothetical protein